MNISALTQWWAENASAHPQHSNMLASCPKCSVFLSICTINIHSLNQCLVDGVTIVPWILSTNLHMQFLVMSQALLACKEMNALEEFTELMVWTGNVMIYVVVVYKRKKTPDICRCQTNGNTQTGFNIMDIRNYIYMELYTFAFCHSFSSNQSINLCVTLVDNHYI